MSAARYTLVLLDRSYLVDQQDADAVAARMTGKQPWPIDITWRLEGGHGALGIVTIKADEVITILRHDPEQGCVDTWVSNGIGLNGRNR